MSEDGQEGATLRIDRWLWHARFCKTRAIAQEKARGGRIYLNGQRIEKAGARLRIGDVLTLTAGKEVIALRVRSLGERRGPASEARGLYEILENA